MKKRDVLYGARLGAVSGIFGATACALVNTAVIAADVSPDSLKLAPGVVKASGYETPATAEL